MRKVLSSLIVLAILVGMFVCLGAQAFAAQEDIAIFAVTDEQLSSDAIARLQEQCTGSLVIDANGFDEGQEQLGYNVVWVESDPQVMSMSLTDAAKVWPGFAIRQEVGPNAQGVIIVGVGEATTAEEVAGAVSGASVSGAEFTIAVGPAAAAEAVKNQVQVFLATGESDGAVSDLESTKLVHIGKDGAPIAAVFVNSDGAVTGADNVPLPEAAAPNAGAESQGVDPDAGAGQPVDDTGLGIGGSGPIATLATVSFAAGEGTGSMESQSAAIGVEFVLPECGFTREGYHFTGWLSGTDWVDVAAGQGYVVTGDVTFTAQWAQDEPETVTFDVTFAPGDGASGTPYVVSGVTAGSPLGMIEMPEGFAKEGYTFTGWLLNGEHYDVGAPYSVSEATTIYAEWTANGQQPVVPASYTVTVDYNNGGVTEGYTQQVDAGASFGLPGVEDAIAPQGKQFDCWIVKWAAGDEQKNPGESITVNENVTVQAQWKDAPQLPEIPVAYVVNFYSGANNSEGTMEPVSVSQGQKLTLPECGFTVPGMVFAGWNVGAGEPVAAGTEIEVTAGMDIYATWKQAEATYTVTYKPGDEAAAKNPEDMVVSDAPAEYALIDCPFIAPDGKTFANWSIGGQPYDAGAKVSLVNDIEVIAVWKDAPVNNQTATTDDGDTIPWTRGDTDKPEVTFNNAEIASVSVSGIALGTDKATVQGKTLTLEPSYLNTLPQNDYEMTITFQKDANGGTFNPYTMTISVTVPPVVTPEPSPTSRTIQEDWTRANNWTHTFDKTPTEVKIYYGTSNGQPVYQTAKSGTDYTVSGNTLTLLPAMVNGNWGGVWPNATYSFRVTLNNDPNDVYTLQLKLTGDAPATTTAPTQTPANNANVPVTGDETPLVLYIVVLLVLIVALAVVLIIVMKRRNSGSRGRH